MKKVLAIIIVICSLFAVASAESMFEGISYDQLFALRSAIEQEIISRPEFKEVTVPTGDWIIGVDIPEGYYSIRPVKYGYILIKDANGRTFLNEAMSEGEIIGKIRVEEGYSIRIEDPFIFSAPKGLDF